MVRIKENKDKLEKVLGIVRKRHMLDAGVSLADVIIDLDAGINELETEYQASRERDAAEIESLRKTIMELRRTILELSREVNYLSRDSHRTQGIICEEW